ncbi:Endo-1,4-beta-xylanase A precursor [compost metagenome]
MTDAAGNLATKTRTIQVIDKGVPMISLIGANPLQIEAGTSFTDPGATAHDSVDGDLTSQITVSGAVYANQVGTYARMYNVTDTGGNKALEVVRTVQVRDTLPPVITLIGEPSITIRQRAPFIDPGAAATDSYDGNLTHQITITGTVDNETVGTYTLVYKIQDSSGNAAAEVVRTVNVILLSQDSGGSTGVVLSTDASLAQFMLDIGGRTLGLTPAFTSGTTQYTAETDAERVELRVTSVDPKAVIKLLDEPVGDVISMPLAVGTQVIVITVQAEDGTQKAYTLTITRHAVKENSPSTPVCAFTDIQNHWAKSDICEAAGLGIVEGVDAHTFVPDGFVTRTEFAIMLMRALQIPIRQESAVLPFSDKESIPEWARPAIHTAVAKGILEGYLEGTVRPQQTINRIEMAAMLSKAMKLETGSSQPLSFSDHASIPAWGQPYVKAVHARGLLQGRESNQFAPHGMTTRAEAAVVMLRLWKTLY